MSWESPIKMIVSDVATKQEECLIRAVQSVGFNVNKEELEKALKYDREQYEKGWNDRDNEIVRCKDCIYRHDSKHGYMCGMDSGDPYEQTRGVDDGVWYCADGIRKDG